ncbi:MAG TPA: HEAT repeat domain-containing protein [Coriobacteriia bacterium]
MATAGPGGTKGAPRAPLLVERFVKQLIITHKAVRLYPGASEIPLESARDAASVLRHVFERQASLHFAVTRDGLLHDGTERLPDATAFVSFAREFYARGLADVRFHAGCTEDDLVRFLTVLETGPEIIAASGGFEAALWEAGVTSITVADVTARVVDDSRAEDAEAVEAQPEEEWPPSSERLREILEKAAAGEARDQRLLVRVISDRQVLRSYLEEAVAASAGVASDAELASRVSDLAHRIRFELPEDREQMLRSLAEAILDLEPDLRRAVFAKRLLAEARHDDTVGEMVRQLSLNEMMDTILQELPQTAEARAGLSRAIRNIAMVALTESREAVMEVASDALRARGADEEYVSSIMAGVAPNRLETKERPRDSDSRAVETVLKLVDLAPKHDGPRAYDSAIAPLKEEAGRGITDGDIVAALVTLTTLEARADNATALAGLLEDRVRYLLDQHEFEIAADAAEALTAAEQDAAIPAAQRRRMRDLLRLLSDPGSMRKITSAMRVYRHDSPESAACRRLLSVLGNHTVSSLLEVLAEEPDMAARKVIVDMLSTMADRFIPDLGRQLEDRRWYFVRNVVAILGATRDPETLQYLGRTLRHPDERVRRETIRAIAGVKDALSVEMLVAALADTDAQNVQLAARYLGSVGGRGVIPALEQAARGEGRGNRETGPRIEAIEALGRVGTESSLRVLDDLSRQRGLAARARELRAAAAAALGALKARGVGR